MLMRSDPFGAFDRLSELWSNERASFMPMDAYRQGNEYVIEIDVPGVEPSAIDVSTEQHSLTVRAKRELQRPEGADLMAAERPSGEFTRALLLSDNFDLERIEANCQQGVLTLRVPLSEKATARQIKVTAGNGQQTLQATGQKAIDVESSPSAN